MDRPYQPLSLTNLPIEANVSLLTQTRDIESLINLFKVNPAKYGPMLNNPVNLLPLIELYGLKDSIKTFGELVNAYDIKYGTKSCLKHKGVFQCSKTAARWGNLRTIEHILNTNPLTINYKHIWVTEAIYAAAEGGHVEIINRLSGELAADKNSRIIPGIITHAIAGDNYWIVDGYKYLTLPYVLDRSVLYGYALKGDLENFISLYPNITITALIDELDLNSYVGRGGNILILDYLISQGRDMKYDTLITGAVDRLRSDFILELEKRGINVDFALLRIAAESNDIRLAGETIAMLGERLPQQSFSLGIRSVINKAVSSDSMDVFRLLASFIRGKDEAENKRFRTKWIGYATLKSPNILRYLLTGLHLPKDKDILHKALDQAIVEYGNIDSIDIILGVDERLLDEAFLIATTPGVPPKVVSHISHLYEARGPSQSAFVSQPYQSYQSYQPYQPYPSTT